MMFHHPVMVVRHVLETKKEKKRLEGKPSGQGVFLRNRKQRAGDR